MGRQSIVAILLAVLAAGCSTAAPAALPSAADDMSSALTLVATTIVFDLTEVTVAAGPLMITFDNQERAARHNLHLRGHGLDEATEIAAGPTVQTLQVTLQPGAYDYLCDVHPGTMTGTLTAR